MKLATAKMSELSHRSWRPKAIYTAKKVAHFPYEIGEMLSSDPRNGKDLRTYKVSGTPYIRVSDLKRYRINYTSVKYVDALIPNSIKLTKNDVLVTRKGTPGIAAIVDENDEGVYIGSEIIRLQFQNKFNSQYLATYLNSKLFYQILLSNLTGTISTGINHPTLKSLKVYYKDEFVKEIATLTGEIAEHEATALNLIHKAQMLLRENLKISEHPTHNHSFTLQYRKIKEDLWTPKYYDPTYKKIEERFLKSFKTYKLGQVCETQKGDEPGSEFYKQYHEAREEDVPFIRTSDLVNYELDTTADYYIAHEIYKDLGQDVKAGDILFTKDGKVGLCAMITKADKAIFASGIVRLRPRKDVSKLGFTSEYIFAALSLPDIGVYGSLRRAVVASTIPHVSEDRLNNVVIPLADAETVKKVSSLIKQAFNLKNEKKRIAKKIDKLFYEQFSDIQF